MKDYNGVLPEFKTLDNDTIPCVGIGTYEKSEEQLSELFYYYPYSRIMIDTAKKYGNENAVSNAIHKFFFDREKVVIIGKVSFSEQQENKVLESFYHSLKLLKIDYFDYYLIHSPRYNCFLQTWETLCMLREKGLIKHAGVSNFEIKHIDSLCSNYGELPIVNQICIRPYSKEKDALINYCQTKGIVVQVAMPFGGHGEDYRLKPGEYKDILHNYFTRGIASVFGTSHQKHMLENLSVY